MDISEIVACQTGIFADLVGWSVYMSESLLINEIYSQRQGGVSTYLSVFYFTAVPDYLSFS